MATASEDFRQVHIGLGAYSLLLLELFWPRNSLDGLLHISWQGSFIALIVRELPTTNFIPSNSYIGETAV